MSEQEQKAIFCKNLNALMKEREKTQIEVANAIGVSHQRFSAWMKGVAIPRMDKIQRLADYFMVSKSALIDEPRANVRTADDDILLTVERMKDDAQFRRLVRYALEFDKKRIEKINGLFGEMNESDKA